MEGWRDDVKEGGGGGRGRERGERGGIIKGLIKKYRDRACTPARGRGGE